MPRKAATAETSDNAAAPRRSTRIKAQHPTQPETKKAPAKPRAKKVEKEAADPLEKPKSRGNKRKAEDEPDSEDAPAVKKVDPVLFSIPLHSQTSCDRPNPPLGRNQLLPPNLLPNLPPRQLLSHPLGSLNLYPSRRPRLLNLLLVQVPRSRHHGRFLRNQHRRYVFLPVFRAVIPMAHLALLLAIL